MRAPTSHDGNVVGAYEPKRSESSAMMKLPAGPSHIFFPCADNMG